MTFQLKYWHSQYNSKTGEVGGHPSGEALGFLGNSVELETITSPGKGQGKLYVFSKHYVSVSNFEEFTQLEQLDLTLLNKTSPEGILIAPADVNAPKSQKILNGSHHYSSVTGVQWSNGVSPKFTELYGNADKTTLSNGAFYIISGAGESHGFWIRREFSENYYLTGEAHATFSVSTPQDGFTGDTEGSPGRPVEGGGTIGGDFFEAPDPPAYHIPLESECDIVVDGSNLTISFFNGFTGSSNITQGNWEAEGMGMGGWTTAQLNTLVASSGGNPIGSQRNEINLISQAINMAVRDKTYYPITVPDAILDDDGTIGPWTYDGYADPLGPIKIGIKGNGGSVKCLDGTLSSSPSSRISKNKPEIFDSAHDNPKKPKSGKQAYADAISGAPEPVATHGFSITYVGLDTGAQMSYLVHGPNAGSIYDTGAFYSSVSEIEDPSNNRSQAPCDYLELFNIKLRPALYGGDVQYFYMVGHIKEHLYVEGVEFMPMDLGSDGATTYSKRGPKEDPPHEFIYADAKSCMRLNHQIFGDTVLKGNGTSRNFPASGQKATFTGVGNINNFTDLVTCHEHQYYIKDGGNLWIIDHGIENSPFHVVTTDRTMFQVRPEFADVTDSEEAKYSGQSPDTNWGYGRNGHIVIKNNNLSGHGTQLLDSNAVHPFSGGFDGGGANLTVWRNTTGDTYFYDNTCTGSYYNCLAAVAQAQDRNMFNGEHGYPMDEVYLRNNTLHSNSATSRETVTLVGMHRLHLLSGNSVTNDGGKETSFGDSTSKAADGFKGPTILNPGGGENGITALLIEHENVDFSGDFGPQARYVDFTGGTGTIGTYIDIDLSDPSGSLEGVIPWLKV